MFARFTPVALLAALAGSVAVAQDLTPMPSDVRINIHIDEATGVETRTVVTQGAYGARAPEVYNAAVVGQNQCPTYLPPAAHVMEDISFGPVGPWAATTNNVIRTIGFPVTNSGTLRLSYDVQVTVWDTANFATNPMIAAGATPLFQGTFPVRNIDGLAYTLTITPATPITVPDNNVWIELKYFAVGTTTFLSNAAGQPSVIWGIRRLTTSLGSTNNGLAIDLNQNGVFQGGTQNAANIDHRRVAFTTGACVGGEIALPIIITGDVPVAPPAATNLGTLTDSTTRTFTTADNQVQFFSFNVAGDVADVLRTFLDITASNSAAANTSMALYAGSGDVIASDQNSGAGEHAQLSFGIGRRAGDGDGTQFDGYDGQLFATSGPFFLAVASGDATFTDAFGATTAAASGSVTLNFRSNVVGGALAASVAPVDLNNGTDVGVLTAPGVQSTLDQVEQRSALWYKFNICTPIDGSTSDNFFDVDFGNSSTAADAIAHIFDASGNEIAVSDDSTATNFLPVFSFGSTGPRGPFSPGGVELIGQTASTLPAGDYYMSVALFPAATLTTSATDGRWHVRPTSGSSLPVRPDFYVGNPECGSTCAPCAADYNNDGGVDGGDVEAFYLAFAASEPCADVNVDGGVDGSDVEAFFLVWFPGGC
jgi:hypothetical protein